MVDIPSGSPIGGTDPKAGFYQRISQNQASQVESGQISSSNAIQNATVEGGSDMFDLGSEVRTQTQAETAREEPTVRANTQADEPPSVENRGSQASISNQINLNPKTSSLGTPEPIESAASDINEVQNQTGEETQNSNQTQGEGDSGANVDRFA